MRIAMLGTRGVPAAYGGFETAVEEIGQRLVTRGHAVTVYCRTTTTEVEPASEHLGMKLVHLPAVRHKALETLSHSAISTANAISRQQFDVALVFNAANAPFLPMLRARRIPIATNVDGLEWKRSKWSGTGQRYYRNAESLSVRWSDALIADSDGIASYYREEFGASSDVIAYGAPIIDNPGSTRIAELGLSPKGFHLVVARFEPENHVHLAVAGYRLSGAKLPLVVVGTAPYGNDYIDAVHRAAADDPRITFTGGIWDQVLLDELYAQSLTYLHGHSVGGTNPSLLRAMGAGAAVLAWDVNFNREVLGDTGEFWNDPSVLAAQLVSAESEVSATLARGGLSRERAREKYDWDAVTDKYEAVCVRLAAGGSQAGRFSGRRSR